MKPFARFMEKKEYEKRVNNILKEYQIRVIKAQLEYFKSQGLTSLDQIENYIEEKKKEGKFDENKDGQTLSFVKSQTSLKKTESRGNRPVRVNTSKEIENSPEFSKLTEEEKNIALKAEIMPNQFLKIKSILIKQHEKEGQVAHAYLKTAAQEIGDNVQQAIGKPSSPSSASTLGLPRYDPCLVVFNYLVKKDAIKRGKDDMEVD